MGECTKWINKRLVNWRQNYENRMQKEMRNKEWAEI